MTVDHGTDEITQPPPEDCLGPTDLIDSDNDAVRAFAARAVGDATDPTEKAIRLFYAVRDEIRYDPYSMRLDRDYYRASHCLGEGRGYCVYKAALMTAASRAQGIPARIGFADVRNHLCTQRLRDLMGTDIFYYHGYAELYLDGKWIKTTPVFNQSLCEKFGVHPLEFDGRNDSLFHEFDVENRRHMEYINDHGSFLEVPYQRLADAMVAVYPKIVAPDSTQASGDFAAEAAAENQA